MLYCRQQFLVRLIYGKKDYQSMTEDVIRMQQFFAQSAFRALKEKGDKDIQDAVLHLSRLRATLETLWLRYP